MSPACALLVMAAECPGRVWESEQAGQPHLGPVPKWSLNYFLSQNWYGLLNPFELPTGVRYTLGLLDVSFDKVTNPNRTHISTPFQIQGLVTLQCYSKCGPQTLPSDTGTEIENECFKIPAGCWNLLIYSLFYICVCV